MGPAHQVLLACLTPPSPSSRLPGRRLPAPGPGPGSRPRRSCSCGPRRGGSTPFAGAQSARWRPECARRPGRWCGGARGAPPRRAERPGRPTASGQRRAPSVAEPGSASARTRDVDDRRRAGAELRTPGPGVRRPALRSSPPRRHAPHAWPAASGAPSICPASRSAGRARPTPPILELWRPGCPSGDFCEPPQVQDRQGARRAHAGRAARGRGRAEEHSEAGPVRCGRNPPRSFTRA